MRYPFWVSKTFAGSIWMMPATITIASVAETNLISQFLIIPFLLKLRRTVCPLSLLCSKNNHLPILQWFFHFILYQIVNKNASRILSYFALNLAFIAIVLCMRRVFRYKSTESSTKRCQLFICQHTCRRC